MNTTTLSSPKTLDTLKLDQLAINTIRFLSVDAIQKADSGHPGLPLGAAPMAYVIWARYLRHNPSHPLWFNRDRFVLSAGHGSMLLYSLLHLTGYDLPMEQIQKFRQFGSITPGHPERVLTPGVETTTGPLGQGFGNGVGMAIAEAYLAARYNRPGFEIINHFTYGMVSDGDLMEGIASEAASLAGHLKLGKLIYLYDDNHITLSASTQLTFTEDKVKRFDAYGWHTQSIEDGNDLEAIDHAINEARLETQRPSIILIRTHIGFGSPDKHDTFGVHGSALGEEEVKKTKENLGWPQEPSFYIPDEVSKYFRQALERGRVNESEWNSLLTGYSKLFPEPTTELRKIMNGELPQDWDKDIPQFPADAKGMSTRVASGKVLQSVWRNLPSLIGGAADLNPSTNTQLKEAGDFENPIMAVGDLQGSAGGEWSYAGRNINFGVREHAMGAILSGLASTGLIPFGGTFLTFSDYMRPAIRLAALMEIHVIYVFTHDSIAMGEDGPSHQPIEHITCLRAIPHLIVIRPCDANETVVAWRIAIEIKGHPVALILSRQNVPTLNRQQLTSADGLRNGAYILSDSPDSNPQMILIATGSEVSLILAAQQKLQEQNIQVRVVSMPSWELFEAQSQDYRNMVLPPSVQLRLAVEAGATLAWYKYIGVYGDVMGIDRFGASAPGPKLMTEYGFTVDNICNRAIALLKKRAPG